MTIKHIVLGGGGPFGVVAFGALKYLHDIKFWNIKEIKSIYSTSIGSLLSVFLTLGYDYDYIYDYIVKRPWEKLFNDIGMENFIDFYNKRGLIDMYPIYFGSFNMLLDANGLSPNITLKEYYDFCGIDLYFITTEINHFNEILGLRNMWDSSNVLINADSTVLDFFNKMIDNIFDYINDNDIIPNIPYDIECDMNIFNSYETWINVPISQEHRAALIDKGSEYGKSNYEKWIQQNIINIKNDENTESCQSGSDNNIILDSDPASLARHNEEL